MEVRIVTDFSSIRCKLRKMEPNCAFICDAKDISFGYISFENHRLTYTGINHEGLKNYKLIKKEIDN